MEIIPYIRSYEQAEQVLERIERLGEHPNIDAMRELVADHANLGRIVNSKISADPTPEQFRAYRTFCKRLEAVATRVLNSHPERKLILKNIEEMRKAKDEDRREALDERICIQLNNDVPYKKSLIYAYNQAKQREA